MNSKPVRTTVKGYIKSIGLLAFEPNSGEVTLNIDGVNYFAGIMDKKGSPNTIEHGVFAAFVSIATVAYLKGAMVECSYLELDKKRIYELVFPS